MQKFYQKSLSIITRILSRILSSGKGKEKENSMRKLNQCVSLEMEQIIFMERLDLT